MSHTYLEKVREDAAEHASSAFREHSITIEGEGRYYFGKPFEGAYHTRIVTAPGALIMFGDVGELILMPSDKDALGWLRMVTKRKNYDLSYIASKVSGDMKDSISRYHPDLVRRWLDWEEEQEICVDCNGSKLASYEVCATCNGEKFYDMRTVNVIRGMRKTFTGVLTYESTSSSAYAWWYEAMNAASLSTDDPPNFNGLTYHFMFQVEMLRHFIEKLDNLWP